MNSSALPLDSIRVWDHTSAPGLVGTDPWARRNYTDYWESGGYSLAMRGDAHSTDVLKLLESLGSLDTLRGRGGAAFPTMTKIRTVAANRARNGRAFVVANGAEGEPLSYKDRYLMQYRPHTVIDGLLLVATAIGAETAFLYVADPSSRSSLNAAVAELEPHRRGGVKLQVFAAQDTYVAGEETAVVRAINTGIARPKDKPPRPFQIGVDGSPTLVLNVETLAWVAHSITAPPQTQTRFLATVSGVGMPTVLYELPSDLRLGSLLKDVTGHETSDLNVLMGGFFGGIVPAWSEMELGFDAVKDRGSSLGCGSIHLIDPATCPVKIAADVAAYYADNNARQCRSCMSSTSAVAYGLSSMGRVSTGTDLLDSLHRWSTQLAGTGACAVPDGVALLLRTLLRHFPTTVTQHIDNGCEDCRKAEGRPGRWQTLSVSEPKSPLGIESPPLLTESAFGLAGA